MKNLMLLDADYMQSCKRDIQVMTQPFIPDVHQNVDYCGYQTENKKVTLTLLSNTVLKHCSETLFSNTVLKHCIQKQQHSNFCESVSWCTSGEKYSETTVKLCGLK